MVFGGGRTGGRGMVLRVGGGEGDGWWGAAGRPFYGSYSLNGSS